MRRNLTENRLINRGTNKPMNDEVRTMNIRVYDAII